MNFNTLATVDSVTKTSEALTSHGLIAHSVSTKEEALEKIKELIPQGASIMNGASRTLENIGFVDYLKDGNHGWNNLHEAILAETDPAKKAEIRRHSVLSDFYLGSVHAATETGELLIASATGSQLPHIVFTSPNLIFVVGAQKIVPTLSDAWKRLEEYVIPLEDENMMNKYKAHTKLNKAVTFFGESAMMGRKVHVIFVNEILGF